ncbi:MAG: hypothetical protein EB068_06095 [Betaproteobacteria bacterium]|nr:hypothetical protein [Betaproteobacteria bacterium]
MRIKRKKKGFEKSTDWKTINKGDVIYINGRTGNYYIGQDGNRTYTTDKGVYTVADIKDNGLFVYGKRGYTYIYMGEERNIRYILKRFPKRSKFIDFDLFLALKRLKLKGIFYEEFTTNKEKILRLHDR